MSILRKASKGGLSAANTIAQARNNGKASLVAPPPAHAQLATVCVNCSQIWTQFMQYAQELDTAITTAQTYANQVQQYENMVQQGLTLPNAAFSNAMQDIRGLNALVSQGRQIAYSTSNLQDQFKQSFPDYKNYLQQGVTWQDAQTQYGKWNDQTTDASLAALKAAGFQMNQITNGDEASVINALQQQSSSATGRMQAIQAGNAIAVEQVKQMQKLRQLMATQMQLQADTTAAAQGRLKMQEAIQRNEYAAPAPTTGGTNPNDLKTTTTPNNG
jgi:P-type conjugative transfer protein TrbJ